jgi:hypothetical protein
LPTSTSHCNPNGIIEIPDFGRAIRDDRLDSDLLGFIHVNGSEVQADRVRYAGGGRTLSIVLSPAETRHFCEESVFPPSRCDGHMRRHILQRINLHSQNSASQRNPPPEELIGEGAPPVFGRSQVTGPESANK